MKDQYVADITEFISTLNEQQLLYILTFITGVFGSH